MPHYQMVQHQVENKRTMVKAHSGVLAASRQPGAVSAAKGFCGISLPGPLGRPTGLLVSSSQVPPCPAAKGRCEAGLLLTALAAPSHEPVTVHLH